MTRMAENPPRVVLFGNTAPINSRRHVEELADVDLDELRARLDDPSDAVSALVPDEDQGIVLIHERSRLESQGANTVSVTRVVPPNDMGVVAVVNECLKLYGTDHSDDPPEWVYCAEDPRIAEFIADHYAAEGTTVAIGIPENWERKRTLDSSGLRMIFEAQGRMDELEFPAGAETAVDGEEHYWDDGMPFNLDGFIAGEFDPWDRFRTAFLRTNAGRDFQSRVMGDTASTGTGTYAAANYIALTTDATTPALTDTTLTSELTASGLGRAQAVYAHTGGTLTYTLTKTFTSSDATPRTINKIGVFNAVSTGTLVFATAVPSPPTLVSGDSLTITETVDIT